MMVDNRVVLQCRAPARENTLRKIYLAETDGDVREDPNTLSNQLDNAKFQLRLKETEKSKISERNTELERGKEGWRWFTT